MLECLKGVRAVKRTTRTSVLISFDLETKMSGIMIDLLYNSRPIFQSCPLPDFSLEL